MAYIELQSQHGAVFAKAYLDREDLLRMAEAFCGIAERPMPPQRPLAS
jgi:hypothetical protein